MLGNHTLTVAAPGVLTNDNDPVGLTMTAVKVTDPSHGSVVLNSDGSFIYIPTTGYSGSDSFTYKVNNGFLDSNVATVSITINVDLSITVTSPNGGEVWATGSSSNAVTWNSSGAVGNVDIDLSTNGGSTWTTLVANTANAGYRSITVPNTYSKTCLVRVKQTSGGSPSDISDANFTITVAGDATGNGYVDGSDLNMLLANWNSHSATWATGDFTGNGYVDGDDLNLLLSHWNVQAPPAGAADVASNQVDTNTAANPAAGAAITGAISSSSIVNTTVSTTDTTTVATTDMSSSASITNASTIVPARTSAAAFTAQINFQPASVVAPEGYLIDSGLPFSAAGNGYTYGWSKDLSAYAVYRNNAASPDTRYDTAIMLVSGGTWEMAVPNGMYDVKIVAGTGGSNGGGTLTAWKFSVEGVPMTSTQTATQTPTATQSQTPTAIPAPATAAGWLEQSITVVVTDGRLTISASPGSSICFVQITGR
jgi:hypothetical protein